MEHAQRAPHAQHINEVLLRNVIFLVNVSLERRKNIALVEK